MAKAKTEGEFTTLYVKKDTQDKVETLTDLVSLEKGVTVKGYDAIACGIEIAIKFLNKKHKVKIA